MSELSFKIDVFEGPLDLLLHLISKNKVSICDIPISTITDQYFEYIELMQQLDMEIGGEFLVMAMNALGITEVQSSASTVFADDASIPSEIKGYVSTAYSLGYIKGLYSDDKLCFEAGRPITRAEAAVIAWMRHQTTAYDRMSIARIKGERREVRRRLAERSRQLLAQYRSGGEPDTLRCPLARALCRN